VTVFAELYHHFVEPHLTESREDWDNLSHGPTYTEKTAAEIEQKASREAEERKAKKAKEKEELAKATEGNERDKVNSEEERLEEKEKAKEENKYGRPPSEEQKQDKADGTSKIKVKGQEPLLDDIKNTEKKLVRKSEEKEDRNPKLEAAEKSAWESFENCRKVCQEREKCFQYVYYDKTCRLGLSFRLGKHVSPSDDGKIIYASGWMVDRIRQWTEDNACKGPDWPDIG
jgi:hypothetical protein